MRTLVESNSLPLFLKIKLKAGESVAVLLLRCLPTAKKAHTGFICSQVVNVRWVTELLYQIT